MHAGVHDRTTNREQSTKGGEAVSLIYKPDHPLAGALLEYLCRLQREHAELYREAREGAGLAQIEAATWSYRERLLRRVDDSLP